MAANNMAIIIAFLRDARTVGEQFRNITNASDDMVADKNKTFAIASKWFADKYGLTAEQVRAITAGGGVCGDIAEALAHGNP